jgi:3-oxoacyl-[acyl-carrier-protein] synthase-3
MIRPASSKNALVIGAEVISPFIDWSDRNTAVLFGDGGAAVVLEATDREEGLLAERLGCYGESREILRVHGMGAAYAHQKRIIGKTEWQFEGQEIFKKAVHGMARPATKRSRRSAGPRPTSDLVIPHQANLRIIEAVARKAGVPMDRVFVNVQRYGNMSAATIPVALCEALEEGRVKPGALLLMPSFGGGLTFTGHVVRWGRRVTPLGATDIDLPPNHQTALEIVQKFRAITHQRVVES